VEKLKFLDLSYNDLDNGKIAPHIENMLEKNGSLRELTLESCKLSSSVFESMCRGLRSSQINTLNLDSNKISKFLSKLGGAVRQSRALKQLTLSNCELTTESLENLLDSIHPYQLRSLTLANNNIDAKSCSTKLVKDFPSMIIILSSKRKKVQKSQK